MKIYPAFFSGHTALGYGILAMGLAFLAGHMGGVLQAAIAVTSSVAGPMLACFIMALFLPFTNYKVRDARQIFPPIHLSFYPLFT